MSQAFKICPICDTPNSQNASMCSNCGTALEHVASVSSAQAGRVRSAEFESQFGETDLLEDSLRPAARRYLMGCVSALLLLMGVGLVMALGPQVMDRLPSIAGGPQNAALMTNTPRPTLALATVTQGSPTLTPSETPPPTATDTPTATPEPCMPMVQELEGLIAVVARCGHRDLFVLTQVIELNNLDSVNDIRPGQILIVPLPTGTPDPNATPEVIPTEQTNPDDASAAGASDETVSNDSQMSEFDFNLTIIADPGSAPTPTLPPGVAYYFVQSQDNAIIVASLFDTSVEALSQLNPEIRFSQCDYGERFGGPRCTVPLSPGQRVRVPAPLPTATLSPTPSGSETPTPTGTPTFNAPSSRSPSDRAFFRADQIITLRWVATGILGEDQVYLVTVERTDDEQTFTATTRDLFFRVPGTWQGPSAERYEYLWSIAVVDVDAPDRPLYPTQPLAFSWEGLGQEETES